MKTPLEAPFPTLQSGPTAVSGGSRIKQFPCNQEIQIKKAIHILFFLLWVMLFTIGPAGPAKATELALDGPCAYFLHATDVRMMAGFIYNNSRYATVANTVSLEVWATTNPYAGAGTITGWQMGKHVFNQALSGQSYWVGVDVTDTTLTRPPPGSYYATLLLMENNAIRFWWPVDSCTFTISLKGTASWARNGSNVRLQVQQVANTSSGGVSGPIRLQLWAFSQPGGSSGYNTATYDFPSTLKVDYVFNNVDQTVAFTAPPTGRYYMSLLALEKYGSTWYTTSRIDFPNAAVFEGEINVAGNGVSIADGDTTPVVTDHTDFGSVAVSGGTVVRTFTIQNLGTSALTVSSIGKSGTHQADFTLGALTPASPIPAGGSATFTVTFDPSASGLRTATLSLANNDANENPYDFAIQGTGTGTGTAPEINVTGNSTNIPDDDTTPSLTDHTDFGSVAVSGGTVVRTFTIQNLGTAALAVSSIGKSGTHQADFTLGALTPASPIPAGDSATFSVTFDPSASGPRTATLSLANNDANENPYNFTIKGTGTAPEMDVLGNNVRIVDGDSTPALTDRTHFGSVATSGGTVVRTFTIRNTGSAALSLTGRTRVVVGGTNAADFKVTTQPPASVAALGTKTFRVTFDPSARGARKATLSIANNDANENPYNFTIKGTGTKPSRSVAAASAALASPTPSRLQATTGIARIDGHKYLSLAVRKPAGDLNFRPRVEVSQNLLDWYSGSKHTTVLQDDEKWLRVRDNTPLTPGTKRFIRLK